MGFLRKYVAISLVFILLLLSAFLSLHTMTDLLAETKGSNVSTKRILEELTVSEDSKVVYVKQDDLLPSEAASNDSVTLLPGYGLYWQVMESVSNWYEPHYFQLVKLLLLTVSLANLAASLLALVCHLLPCTSNAWLVTASLSSLSNCRCGHPTPLLLVEASLTLALMLLLLMAVLGRQTGLVGQQEVLLLGALMLIVGIVSWQIGEHYKEERKIHNEKKLLDFETFEYCNTSDEENEEDPNVQQIIDAEHNHGNRLQELPRVANTQRNVTED